MLKEITVVHSNTERANIPDHMASLEINKFKSNLSYTTERMQVVIIFFVTTHKAADLFFILHHFAT
jgi:hypothetical protein